MGCRVDWIYRPEAFVALDATFDPVADAQAPAHTRAEPGARADAIGSCRTETPVPDGCRQFFPERLVFHWCVFNYFGVADKFRTRSHAAAGGFETVSTA